MDDDELRRITELKQNGLPPEPVELRRTMEGQRERRGLPAGSPAPKPVEFPCRVCGKGIAYPGPRDGRIIAAWNAKAGEPPCFTCRACRDEAQRRERQ